MDFENFVGNSGGYIGLFVGYSILQAPDLIFAFYVLLRRLVDKWILRSSHSRNSSFTHPEENQFDGKLNISSLTHESKVKKQSTNVEDVTQKRLDELFLAIKEIRQNRDRITLQTKEK